MIQRLSQYLFNVIVRLRWNSALHSLYDKLVGSQAIYAREFAVFCIHYWGLAQKRGVTAGLTMRQEPEALTFRFRSDDRGTLLHASIGALLQTSCKQKWTRKT
jgi:hypothetical protein